MSSSTALLQVSQFLEFLRSKPNFQTIMDYLSENISPDREICGVGLFFLGENGVIDTVCRSGISQDFPLTEALPISSKHPIAEAFRNDQVQVVDFKNIEGRQSDLLEEQIDFGYNTAITGAINEQFAIGFLLDMEYQKAILFKSYFESLISAMRMFVALQSKKFINLFEMSRILTVRQSLIYEMILDGKSNREIANELSFSVSLIRQESMRIYAKLGVDGRQDLKKQAPKARRFSSSN